LRIKSKIHTIEHGKHIFPKKVTEHPKIKLLARESNIGLLILISVFFLAGQDYEKTIRTYHQLILNYSSFNTRTNK